MTVRSYNTYPGASERETDDERIRRAAGRVTLACRALSEAANDLRVAYVRTGMTPVDDAADQVASETERVCELAEELSKLANHVQSRHAVAALATPAK
jgi:hypothetical protein